MTHRTAADTLGEPLFDMVYPDFVKHKRNSLPLQIEFINGSRIVIGGGHKKETWQGKGFDLVVLDEVGDQDPKLLLQYLMPTLSDRKGELLLIGTPKGLGMDWVNEQFGDNKDFKEFTFASNDGGFIDEEEMELQRINLPDKVFRQEYLAEQVQQGGLVAEEFGEDNIIKQEFNPNRDLYISFDFNNNKMSFNFIQMLNNSADKYVCTNSFATNLQGTYDACLMIDDFLKKRNFIGNLMTTGDYAGNQGRSSSDKTDWMIINSFFKNYRNYKSKVRVTKSIKGRVNTLNVAFFRKNFFIDESCKVLIKELKTLQWIENSWKINDNGGKVGHIFDALNYFTMVFLPLAGPVRKMRDAQ